MLEYSRSGNSSPLGKRTQELRCRVDGDTEEILSRLARREEMTLSEFLAMKLMIEAHGIEKMQSLYASRLSRIARIGKESAQKR